MSHSSDSPPVQLKSRIGAILRATSGNFLEQFDFFLFGFYAPYIAKAFFPSDNETASLLAALAIRNADYARDAWPPPVESEV